MRTKKHKYNNTYDVKGLTEEEFESIKASMRFLIEHSSSKKEVERYNNLLSSLNINWEDDWEFLTR